jgi:GH15 family glucan-1,4-alpha-glucosidase
MRRTDGFAPIGAYAALGDGRTVALVADDGAVDFMSLPELHSPTVFAALLDPDRGGRFVLAPTGEFEAERRYLDRTNVLETTYRTGAGAVRVTEALTLQDGGLLPWIELTRRVEGMDGEVEVGWRVEPRFDWGRVQPTISRRNGIAVAEGSGIQLGIHSWELGEPRLGDKTISGSSRVRAGQSALLTLVATSDQPLPLPRREHVEARLDATSRVWERWLGMWAYDGPWQEEVARSALALKLIIYAPTGSIAAAATTSLPEVVGGDKNYDYRYGWVRDSAYTLDALMRLGLPEQVHESFHCLLRAVRGTAPDLRPFYDLEGHVPERAEELSQLRGYRGSRPVRYGNAALAQLQLGSWGDLLETADLYASEGNALDDATADLLAACVDRIAVIWQDEDSGIWELHETRHYTSSKISAWTALDRALRLVDEGQIPGDHAPQWREQRERVHRWIEEWCWSRELGSYAAWPGSDGVDAALLRAVRVGYPERARLEQTLDTICEQLTAGGPLLYRTSEHAGREGAFLACSFWAVEALARLGRVDEAVAMMDDLLGFANDLGLLSEQVDPDSRELLGNFPQGLSHLALINAAGAVEDAGAAPRTRAGARSAKAGAARR